MQFEVKNAKKTGSTEGVGKKGTLLFDIGMPAGCLLGDHLLSSTVLIFLLCMYLILRILFTSIEKNFALFMLLIPNVGIMIIQLGGLSVPILNVLISGALLKLLLTFVHLPLKKTSMFIIGLYIVYEWIHMFNYSVHAIILLMSWSAAVLYASLFLFYSKTVYNHFLVVTYFIAGVCLSTVFGILDFLDRYGSLFNNNATIRFHGGAGDANYYSMYILMAMFCILYIVNRETKKLTKVVMPILFVCLLAFGFLSLSRMFLLVGTLLCGMLLIHILFSLKRRKRLFTFITSVASLIVLVAIYFSEKIRSNMELLFSRFTDFIDDPAALTSNRNLLAEQYMELFTSNPLQMMFGMGIQDYHIRSGIYLETHNILLELLVVWGIVGVFVFAIFLLMYFKESRSFIKKPRTNLIGWLPLLCIGASFMSINAMSNESFFLLLLFTIKHLYEFD